MSSKLSDLYYDRSTSNLELNKIVSGEGFTCGSVKEGGLVCWGPNSTNLGVSNVSENFALLTSGRNSICGILNISGDLKCWGDANSFADPPVEVKLVTVSVGVHHFCGIRADNHLVECWGSFNTSVAPKASGFIAIASSDYKTCGVREEDLLLDYWLVNASKLGFDPPLELSSPGLYSASSCSEDMGERLLVYEYMPHGTLHDHLHGGLSRRHNERYRLRFWFRCNNQLQQLRRRHNLSRPHQ